MGGFGGVELTLDSVRRVAAQTGCKELAIDHTVAVAAFKNQNGSEIHVHYNSGTVGLVLHHPRQGPFSVYQYGVDPGLLADIFAHPLNDAPYGYRSGPFRPIPLEREEDALRRHFAVLEKEKEEIAGERAELRRRAQAAGFNLEDSRERDSNNGVRGVARAAPRARSGRQSDCEPEDYEASDGGGVGSDNEMSAAIGKLLRQQSDVNAQLESLVIKRNARSSASKRTTAAGSSAPRRGGTSGHGGGRRNPSAASQSIARSASLKRGPSRSGGTAGPMKSLTRGAANSDGESDSAAGGGAAQRGGDDGSPPRVPFQAQKSMINASASMSQVNAPYRQRGNQCCYALAKPEYHAEFGTAWSAKPANVVALGRGYVILYDDGSVTWWDVPQLLDTKLKDNTAQTQSVRYVALGTDENYYVKFMDGKMEWCGPDAFGEALKRGVQKNRLLVDKVAFGANQGWLILWSDGSAEHSRVPASLAQLLEEKSVSGDDSDMNIKDIAIGPQDEWFVIFKDNSVRADNLPDALYRILSEIQEANGRVRQVIFGENSSWYVRYWDGKIN